MKYLILFMFLCSQVIAYEFIGSAHSHGNKDYIYYTEEHAVVQGENNFANKITTVYKDPKGEVIGQLVSDFSKNKLIPDIVFDDKRSGEKVVSKLNKKVLNIKIFKDGKESKNKDIKIVDKMFFGQGWHNCVMKIINSKNYGTSFYTIALEGDVDTVEFKVESRKNEKTGNVEFQIGPKNFFLRFITGNLIAHYNEKTYKLEYFKGLTNILDEKQKRYDAEIDYKHL